MMKPLDELKVSQTADKIIAVAVLLKEQSQALVGTALYLETLSTQFDHLAKDIKEILNPQETLLDLPLEVL